MKTFKVTKSNKTYVVKAKDEINAVRKVVNRDKVFTEEWVNKDGNLAFLRTTDDDGDFYGRHRISVEINGVFKEFRSVAQAKTYLKSKGYTKVL